MSKPFVIGVCGGSASGKSYLIQRLRESLPLSSAVFALDAYYKPRATQQKDALGFENFDLPEALDTVKMESDWQKLLQGQSIEQPIYNYNNPTAETLWQQIQPQPIILVDGIFTFYFDFLDEALDYRIIIDASFETKKQRRMERDVKERGYDVHQIDYRFSVHAEESYLTYVCPFKGYADFPFENEGDIEKTLQFLLKQLNNKMNR